MMLLSSVYFGLLGWDRVVILVRHPPSTSDISTILVRHPPSKKISNSKNTSGPCARSFDMVDDSEKRNPIRSGRIYM
jgi:hypothetical protein